MRLLIATHNQGKLKEFQELLADFPLEVISLDDTGVDWDVDETGATFEANALLKAGVYGKTAGMATLADDSGLEVDALGGEPGVLTARFGGPGLTPQQGEDLKINLIRSLRGLSGTAVTEALRTVAERDPSARVRSEARRRPQEASAPLAAPIPASP